MSFRKKESKMNQHGGLCLSCRNALTCTFLKNPNEAVLQCDEFDGFESFLRRPKIFSHKSMMDLKSNPGKKDLGGYKGLCSICEDRKACTYPKPEGGVWHCEEYR
jgi:hypothetical protein